MKALSDLSATAIADNILRYRERGIATGGPWSLAELLAEQHRRAPVGRFATVETAQTILRLATTGENGLVNYIDLWCALAPTRAWKGHGSLGELTNALERVQHHCLRHGLPLLATLVVNKSEGALTADARANIANWARDNGISVGLNPDQFVSDQQAAASEFARSQEIVPEDAVT